MNQLSETEVTRRATIDTLVGLVEELFLYYKAGDRAYRSKFLDELRAACNRKFPPGATYSSAISDCMLRTARHLRHPGVVAIRITDSDSDTVWYHDCYIGGLHEQVTTAEKAQEEQLPPSPEVEMDAEPTVAAPFRVILAADHATAKRIGVALGWGDSSDDTEWRFVNDVVAWDHLLQSLAKDSTSRDAGKIEYRLAVGYAHPMPLDFAITLANAGVSHTTHVVTPLFALSQTKE